MPKPRAESLAEEVGRLRRAEEAHRRAGKLDVFRGLRRIEKRERQVETRMRGMPLARRFSLRQAMRGGYQAEIGAGLMAAELAAEELGVPTTAPWAGATRGFAQGLLDIFTAPRRGERREHLVTPVPAPTPEGTPTPRRQRD